MTAQQKEMIIGDFEKFMQYTLKRRTSFTLETFVSFATSLVNFYKGSNLISNEDRQDTSLLLCQCYNAGVGNQIATEDLIQIAELIYSDQSTLDYSIINSIFSH